jgi:tripartite ATP-independent transporter DctP family solute receptor
MEYLRDNSHVYKTKSLRRKIMKNAKKLVAMLLALVMVVALCACGSSTTTTTTTTTEATEAPAADDAATADTTATDDGEKVGETVLKCAFNQTIDNPEAKTLQYLSDLLYDATEGRYSIEVYPDAQLGDQAQTLEQVTMGTLDMALVANSIVETYASDFAIIGTPYVYDSIEHQEKVFLSGALDELYATTEQYGFTVLSAYSLGARNLYTRDKAVTTPEELAGMKIRVMGSDTCIAMMNAMGGVGVAMAQGDVYSAIQTGTLDGAENNIITYVDLVQYEVAPYYNYTGHLMIPDELCIATDVLAAMSEEDQAALKECATESITYMFDLCDELRADYVAKAEAQGVIFSEADVAAFQAACADVIADVAGRNDLTQSVYDAILSLR